MAEEEPNEAEEKYEAENLSEEESRINESSEEEYEDIPCKPTRIRKVRGPPTCARLEEISRPRRHCLLALYEMYGHLLPPENFTKVKKMLEEAYSMTPEQTKAYFQQLQKEAKKRKRLKQQKRKEKLHYKQLKSKEIEAKIRFKVVLIIRDCMIKAYLTPMKILMSERLRLISDVCLRQVCKILGRQVPDRDSKERISRLLISFCDWMAYWIETIAFDIEAAKESSSETETTVSEIKLVTSQTQTNPLKKYE